MCETMSRTLKGRVRRDTLWKFYKVLVVPFGLYGGETWTLNTRTHSRIQACEMTFSYDQHTGSIAEGSVKNR